MFNELAERVNKRTGGTVTIRVFPSEQLGKEADLVQQVKQGALDMSAPSMAVMSALVPAMEMASGPFLWKDWAEAETVLRGTAFDPIWAELRDKHNIVPVTKILYWGWRNFTFTEREVRKPADMEGLKVRVPESPIWVEMVRAFGAAPTPIPFGEVYTALQQKTVDGQENPIPTIYARKFYEVQGVLSMTRHMLQNNTIVINKNSLAKLTPDQQKILLEEAAAVSAKNTELQQGREKVHARGHPQVGQDQGHRRARPRRLPGQGATGLRQAGSPLGRGQPQAPAGRDRTRARQVGAPWASTCCALSTMRQRHWRTSSCGCRMR